MVGSAIGDGGGVAAMMRRAMAAAAMVLLLCGPSQAQVGFSGYNDIATVAAHGRTDEVIRELQAGRSPSVRDDRGATALHYAAQLGDQRMANALLYYKAPVDARDQFGNTPLHWAAQRGSIPVMQLLLASGASVDVQNKQGVTPLMMAAKAGQLPAARLLVKAGADPRRADFTGRTAIGWADGKPAVEQFLRNAK